MEVDSVRDCSTSSTSVLGDLPTSRRTRRYCGHCCEYVGYSTFYRHRSRYYDEHTKQWSRSANHQQTTGTFGLESDSDTDTELQDTFDHSTVNNDREEDEELRPLNEGEELIDENAQSDDSSSSDEVRPTAEDLEEVWPSESESDSDDQQSNQANPAIFTHLKVLLMFLAMWQFAHKVSNGAIDNLLRFLKFFLHCLGKAFNCDMLLRAGEAIPVRLVGLHKILQINQEDFVRYVVCPACSSVYAYQDCIITRANGLNESKLCCHIPYPNHPQTSRRKPCGTILLKKVRTKRSYNLQPRKIYPYLPLKKSVARLVKKNGFVQSCERWRYRPTSESTSYLTDIYDGLVWKRFNSADMNFLSSPHCYLLTMNVDWFQPYERSVYSVGAIYLTVQNLPRNQRHKPDNIIIVGIIPGPKEPNLTINSFLTPLVLELQEAWSQGFALTTAHNTRITVRLAVACVACDIPASRKVSGFLGHNATLGCNKCLKQFKVEFGKSTDYSGIDRENWPARSQQQHRRDVTKVLSEVTKTGQAAAQSRYGVRYSALLALPYFDPVQFTVIDVMHNLFLGTGKHMLDVWLQNGLLDIDKLKQIELKINQFRVPADVGRVPGSISSSFGGFTANQWRNWITIYSPVVLKGLLPQDHLQCWLLYVQACSLLCSRILRQSDVHCADRYLLEFCRKLELLYEGACTANTHLHLHLKESFLNYGPPHAFWCFAFERYNGILGSYHTNMKAIEVQLLKKFCQDQAVHSLQLPSDATFHSLLPGVYKDHHTTNSGVESSKLLYAFHLPWGALDGTQNFGNSGVVVPLPPYREIVLDSISLDYLTRCYNYIYPNKRLTHVSPFCYRYGRVTLADDLIGSVLPGPNNSASSVIMAYWPGTGCLGPVDYSRMRVGVVQHFIKHTVSFCGGVNDNCVEHIFAYVKWKQYHPDREWFGISATVCVDMFELSGPCNFIPVQRIAHRCAHAILPIDFANHTETVFVACPVPVKYSL